MDEERSESDVVAQSGPQEGICEQGCADASSLRAQIDGEARKEENGARIRTSSRFERLWESDALHGSRGKGVKP
jgi:hypothetical protein